MSLPFAGFMWNYLHSKLPFIYLPFGVNKDTHVVYLNNTDDSYEADKMGVVFKFTLTVNLKGVALVSWHP